jgi:hypothetical protein
MSSTVSSAMASRTIAIVFPTACHISHKRKIDIRQQWRQRRSTPPWRPRSPPGFSGLFAEQPEPTRTATAAAEMSDRSSESIAVCARSFPHETAAPTVSAPLTCHVVTPLHLVCAVHRRVMRLRSPRPLVHTSFQERDCRFPNQGDQINGGTSPCRCGHQGARS